jgi:integration host factor subunit alpha
MRVNKSHLAKAVTDRTGLSGSLSSQVIDVMTASIARSLASGNEVRISGFGKFQIQTRKSRTVRNPRTGEKIEIQSRRTVGFKCFQHLKNRVNGAQPPGGEPPGRQERRSETDRRTLPQGRAVVRICGIPVCEFTVKDVSGNGTSFLMARDSVVLRNLQVGQEIEIHMVFAEGNRHSTMQRSKIAHITHQKDGTPYQGYVLVGLRVIDRI